MKTVGLIGGMSWESTVTYYQILNQVAKEKLGGLHSARCIVYSVEFSEIEKYQASGEWEKAGEILSDAARKLQLAGADMILLGTNTMHKVAEQIKESIDVPFLHIADATAEKLKAGGIKKAILLGTRYTMDQDFIKEPLKQQGIDIIVPDEEEKTEINRIIFEELCLGKIEESSADYMMETIQKLSAAGGQGVILGCTEIGLLIKQENSSIPVFDTALIHAAKAAQLALEN